MPASEARRLRISGTVQGVGFRPFVARLAETHGLSGWVLNGEHGVDIHIEGPPPALDAFAADLSAQAPPAARIDGIDAAPAAVGGFDAFLIRPSQRRDRPTAGISPDLPVCGECLKELMDPGARRCAYPYVNCTNCGPRFSIIHALPYDRARTTMAAWTMCRACAAEYLDARDRRFHAQPVACPRCGPTYRLLEQGVERVPSSRAIEAAARLLREGRIVALKGIGGYHLGCDASNHAAVAELRQRKYRKAKPFAVMVNDLATARALAWIDDDAEAALTSAARPIVLVPARVALEEVAPGHRELGIMLPYAPLHHLLFAAGAPDALVMTSANASSEPIAYDDADAFARLAGIADAFLVGERSIARRVDDSVVRARRDGLMMLRRSRGYAPASVARLPGTRPILALGADLKNTITLVVDGQALVSQHIGDLEHFAALEAFQQTIRDLTRMYDLNAADLLVAHDRHPHYASTAHALEIPAAARRAVQHHHAHVASVLAERGALDTRVVGVAFDGTGYGDDGSVWGGEFFVGSLVEGFRRVASLRPFALPGGDAAARHPVQAAAGCLADVDGLPDLTAPPFSFPARYRRAAVLIQRGVRVFGTTSAGRLFDAVAALLGFTSEMAYEGQAAIWLEELAWKGRADEPLAFEFRDGQLDVRPALRAIAGRRLAHDDPSTLARVFHDTMAAAVAFVARQLCDTHGVETIVVSGGTFQNVLLLDGIRARLDPSLQLWTNHGVPPNDGGISLGQAAIAACAQ